MKITWSVFIVAASIFQSGCTSYSFRGAHTPSAAAPVVRQYKLDRYSSDIKSSLTPWSISRFAGKQVSKRDVERTLVSLYPDRFVRAEDAVPVNVMVRGVESKCNAWGLVPYFLTLGIYPANVIRYEDQCEVVVSVEENRSSGRVKFRSNGWLSVWTPFGGNRTDSQDGYTGAYEKGGGLMVAPHTNSDCYDKQTAVYIAEIAAEINVGVVKLERAEAAVKTAGGSAE